MGRVAGAPGGGRLTDWAFTPDAVPGGAAGAVVLVLSPADVARLGPRDASRSATRQCVLAALASHLIPTDPRPRLAVAADGVRHVAGGWFASVAERDGWGAAALARHPVGIDLEAVAEAEQAADAVLAGVVAVDRAAWPCLAGVWAAREAVLKAVGRDLTHDPGGWRFGSGTVSAAGIAAHRVETVARGGIVAALAYVGG